MDAAMYAAEGFVQYENMPGPPEVVKDGKEPADLLALLASTSSEEQAEQPVVDECPLFSKDYQVMAACVLPFSCQRTLPHRST
jgi:hypothetical protein